LFDQGLLLERLVWVLKAEHWLLQDINLKENTILRTQILQDLNNVGLHHCENFLQVGFQGSGH
jgi:hypothetical protein